MKKNQAFALVFASSSRGIYLTAASAVRTVWLVVISLVLGGCVFDGGDRAPPPPRVAPAIEPQLHDLVQAAKADLRARLALQPGQTIQVISAQVVSWPNAAIGCPREGRIYTQAVTTGSRIELRNGGASYLYHGRGLNPAALCETNVRSPLPKLPQPVVGLPKPRNR